MPHRRTPPSPTKASYSVLCASMHVTRGGVPHIDISVHIFLLPSYELRVRDNTQFICSHLLALIVGQVAHLVVVVAEDPPDGVPDEGNRHLRQHKHRCVRASQGHHLL